MPYNNFLLVVALKPRMNTDIYIYIIQIIKVGKTIHTITNYKIK